MLFRSLLPIEYKMNQSYERFIRDLSEGPIDIDPESPRIKASYEDSKAQAKNKFDEVQQRIKENDEQIKNLEKQIEDFKKQQAEILKKVNKEVTVPTYHSTFNAKPEELLDWNSTQQSDLVSKVFEKFGIKLDNKFVKKEIEIGRAHV